MGYDNPIWEERRAIMQAGRSGYKTTRERDYPRSKSTSTTHVWIYPHPQIINILKMDYPTVDIWLNLWLL